MAKNQDDKVLKIANLTEQYNSIVGNIAIANTSLEKVLSEISSKKDELNKLDTDILSRVDTADKLSGKARELSLSLDAREKEKVNLEKEIVKIERDHQEKLTDISLKVSLAKQEEAKLIGQIANLYAELSEAKKEKSKQVDAWQDQIELTRIATKKRVETETDLKQIEERLSVKSAEYAEMIEQKKSILAGIDVKIESNKKKIEAPFAKLKEQEFVVDNKVRNLNTLIRRFKGYMKTYFPNQEIKI